jgi:hypothetical protein
VWLFADVWTCCESLPQSLLLRRPARAQDGARAAAGIGQKTVGTPDFEAVPLGQGS